MVQKIWCCGMVRLLVLAWVLPAGKLPPPPPPLWPSACGGLTVFQLAGGGMKIKSADRECLKDGLCLLTPGGGGGGGLKETQLYSDDPSALLHVYHHPIGGITCVMPFCTRCVRAGEPCVFQRCVSRTRPQCWGFTPTTPQKNSRSGEPPMNWRAARRWIRSVPDRPRGAARWPTTRATNPRPAPIRPDSLRTTIAGPRRGQRWWVGG